MNPAPSSYSVTHGHLPYMTDSTTTPGNYNYMKYINIERKQESITLYKLNENLINYILI